LPEQFDFIKLKNKFNNLKQQITKNRFYLILLLSIFLHIKENSQTNNNSNFNYLHPDIESIELSTHVKLVISLPEGHDDSKEINYIRSFSFNDFFNVI
jgi:hypothetical protein